MARRACSSLFGAAPFWGLVLAVAAFVAVAFAPRAAFAATPAGLCDERGLSAIAPLPVVHVSDAALEATLAAGGEGPQLCEVDATAGCRLEPGHPGAPPELVAIDLEPALGVSDSDSLIKPPVAFRVRASWPPPDAAFVPPGWRRRVEHPPRA